MRERPDGDGAGDGSSEAGRVLEGDRPRRGSAGGASIMAMAIDSGWRLGGLTYDWRPMRRA